MPGKAYKFEPEHLQPVKVEHIADCGDCGATDILNRTVCYTLVDKPHTHWREKCINCKRHKHPISGEWLEINAVELYRKLQELNHN
jgi:hypothetical protein